jgi:hypothetical protein
MREFFVDLGITQLIAAQKAERKIAIEIKGFTSRSAIADLEQALGQYLIYRAILEKSQDDCLLYLAIRQATYTAIFSEPIRTLISRKYQLNLLVFSRQEEEIVQWIP